MCASWKCQFEAEPLEQSTHNPPQPPHCTYSVHYGYIEFRVLMIENCNNVKRKLRLVDADKTTEFSSEGVTCTVNI
jgi:hypothetical protein